MLHCYLCKAYVNNVELYSLFDGVVFSMTSNGGFLKSNFLVSLILQTNSQYLNHTKSDLLFLHVKLMKRSEDARTNYCYLEI